VDLSAGVAVRFSALCLDPAGRLGDYLLWQTAVRGAVLVDLASAGRLAQTDDSITIDEIPTGFGPADNVLRAITVEHERSLDWWVDHGPVRLRDVAAANVASGRWAVAGPPFRRRYRDLHLDATARDRARGGRRPESDWSPDTAAVAAIARAAGADGDLAGEPPQELLALTGPARWICQAVTDHLADAHSRNQQAAWGGGGIF
jgi:Golgi phosphoprotein 3 (GPP34)